MAAIQCILAHRTTCQKEHKNGKECDIVAGLKARTYSVSVSSLRENSLLTSQEHCQYSNSYDCSL